MRSTLYEVHTPRAPSESEGGWVEVGEITFEEVNPDHWASCWYGGVDHITLDQIREVFPGCTRVEILRLTEILRSLHPEPKEHIPGSFTRISTGVTFEWDEVIENSPFIYKGHIFRRDTNLSLKEGFVKLVTNLYLPMDRVRLLFPTWVEVSYLEVVAHDLEDAQVP